MLNTTSFREKKNKKTSNNILILFIRHFKKIEVTYKRYQKKK